MANNHTKIHANKRNGELTASSTTTDAPLLPIQQIAQLKEIMPSRLDWVFEQTEKESEHRRTETKRVNTLIFVERFSGQVFALLFAICGLAASVYLAVQGKEITASVIGGGTLVGIVAAFISGRKK
jgi:uncharacterized membrane protein